MAPIERPRLTGTERYALHLLAALLAEPRAADFDWRFYQRGQSARTRILEEEPRAGAANVRFVTLGQGRLWTHRRLGGEVSTNPPDVLFVPAHVLPVALPGRRVPPCVVTFHDIGYRHVPEGHTAGQRAYLEWSTRDGVRRAAAILAPSRATAADLVHFYGANAALIHVIHEAHSPVPEAGAAANQAVLERLGLTRPYALFLGTVAPRKNLVRLAQAWAGLHAAGQAEFDLVLAGGDGPLAAPIRTAVAAIAPPDRVRFTGYLDEGARAALLRGATCLCYPSLVEGFGLPVLEAQSVGVPVLTANNSSLPEVAGDGALLVDPTDVEALAQAMLQLSRDESLRTRLIAAGRENVKRFSWQKAARETLDVLAAVARSSPRR